jgi:hypothetical protein
MKGTSGHASITVDDLLVSPASAARRGLTCGMAGIVLALAEQERIPALVLPWAAATHRGAFSP